MIPRRALCGVLLLCLAHETRPQVSCAGTNQDDCDGIGPGTRCCTCMNGKYKPIAGTAMCTKCPAGTTSVAGASSITQCTNCAANTYSYAGSGCYCNAGYYAPLTITTSVSSSYTCLPYGFGTFAYSWRAGTKQTDYQEYANAGYTRVLKQIEPSGQWVGTVVGSTVNYISQISSTRSNPFPDDYGWSVGVSPAKLAPLAHFLRRPGTR